MTQEEAAKRAGVSASTWRKIESGEVPKPRQLTIIRIGRGLHADPNPLLIAAGLPGDIDEPEANDYRPIGSLDTEYRLSAVEKVVGQLSARAQRSEVELREIKDELGEVKQLMTELVAAGPGRGGGRRGSA